jgi:hypothetical protein
LHWPILHTLPEPQSTHAAPPVPHSDFDCEPCCTHVPPLQHPVGHEVASHTHAPVVVSHSCPDEHAAHIAPLVPQALLDCDPRTTHAPPAVQQPPEHVLALHTQWPVLVSHSVPEGHAAHSVPPAPHDAVDSLDSGSHVAPEVQQPAHAEPPQVHAPPEQLPPAAQGAHVAPAVPHEELDCEAQGTHWPLAVQQPSGQVAWSHAGAVSVGESDGASCPCATSAPGASFPVVPSLASSPERASLPAPLLPEDAPWPSGPASPPGAGP